MAVDKDLLYPGNKEYAPDKCCIIPQTLNTMLSNCKKHKVKWKSSLNLPLPLCVNPHALNDNILYSPPIQGFYKNNSLCSDPNAISCKISCR